MYVQLAPAHADTPIQSIGDPKTNIGKFVRAVLRRPEQTLPGRYVSVVSEQTSLRKLLKTWSDVLGKEATFVQVSPEDYNRLWPGWGNDMGPMFQYYDEYGIDAWNLEDGILTAQDLGVKPEELVSVEDCLRGILL